MAVLLTLAISLIGVGLFHVAALPLPWLLGPMFACLVAALAGLRMQGTPRLSLLMRTVLGVAIGATITPALFAQIPGMALSLALIPVLVFAIGAVGYPFFRRVFGFDRATAYYAAMPGGLQDMLLFGEEAGGDVRALSLIHATRVLIIVTVLPFVFSLWLAVDLSVAPGAPAMEIPPWELLVMVAAGLVGWLAARAIGLFGASILGPMILTAALSLGDVLHFRPPAEAIYAAQFFIGTAVGVKYAGVTWGELNRDVLAGVGFTVLIFGVALVFAGAAIASGALPIVEALLAFSPGGQAEMAILAIMAGADVAVVVAHHLIRLVVVILGAPLFARVFG